MDVQEFDDNVITQFCDIADTTPDVAKDYLSVADGILENALQLYFSGFEIPKKSVEVIPTDNNFEEGTSSNIHHQPAPPIIDDVRAPIAATTDILVDDYNYGSWQQSTYQQSFQSLDPFRDFSTETGEFRISDDEQDEETWNKSQKLSELFKIPSDIIFNGSFEEAREDAKQNKKWLLVNIQDSSEFDCQLLNRDLWKNEDVKSLVREHFIFIQYPITSREGQQYKQFYPFEKYPHISLVDPRTGERIRVWDEVVKADIFVVELTNFLIANNLQSSQPLKTNMGNSNYIGGRNIDTMSEEEQINMAMKMSMNDQNLNHNNESITIDDDDEYYEFMDDDYESDNNSQLDEIEENEMNEVNGQKEEDESFVVDESLSKDELCEKFHKKIKAIVNPEPTSGNTTDIQFRLPDGKRIIRSFLIEDKVLVLFEYIKGSVPEAKEQPFDLLNFRESLIDKINDTIHDAGVEDSAISVSYV
ncbi:hypothetical protein BCR36DRAFT_405674 [Piromyces finnis]|uniref:UBX domain-containing protein n=1 Tax=Piromyces finnis TaxID=1754191 RepID=A0A1Y1V3I7_9FUNG|nr:hypothetical protein BCR36DRAFT_405674 [Piromyces finnis]|eukprot:ORX46385.1 hypothetical protein BCR36DRAFT_405674 [Piromyces finnis]